MFADKTLVEGRYNLLKGVPENINQDLFGICGMTSIVYLLLKQNTKRLDELYLATFADILGNSGNGQFATASGQSIRISLRYLCRKYERAIDQYVYSQDNEDKIKDELYPWTVKTQFFVDYCLSRALGYLLWKQDESRYMREKLSFNAEFSPSDKTQDWSRIGNLALRTNNLAYIVAHIVGASCVTILRNKRGLKHESSDPLATPPTLNTSEKEFETADELITECKILNKKQYALAAIFAEMVGAPKNTNSNLSYDHWIVILEIKEIANNKTKATVKYWTWGNEVKDVTVTKMELLEWVQDLIFVQW
jgi:hypothetical protein